MISNAYCCCTTEMVTRTRLSVNIVPTQNIYLNFHIAVFEVSMLLK